ncbi:MAG TPA: hypothetical protein DIS96_11715 [Pusillimonas sp.]|nr:hypothetical protein [Pusillimonas sp.]
MFLTDEQLADFTEIRTGKGGKTREQLQCEHLRKIGVPFYPSARGKPMVVAEVLTGRKIDNPKPKWQPKVLQMR